MFYKVRNNLTLIVYQGHWGVKLLINSQTSLVGTFTKHPTYFSVPLLPSYYKGNYMKFNIVTHNEDFKFQTNNKITENMFLFQKFCFISYYKISYLKPLPIWYYNQNKWIKFNYAKIAFLYSVDNNIKS